MKYSLVHDLASEVASNPSGTLATQLKADPAKALKDLAAPPLDVQHDKWVYRMIVGGLISIVLGAMIGTCLLLWHSGTISVESLTAMGSAAVGGLVGILVPSPAQARTPQS